MNTLRAYYDLAKPGIIYGNLIALLSGYALAARGAWHAEPLLMSALGLSCIIGSACAVNNIWDKDIDAKMERTQGRALVRGTISTSNAAAYASLLFILGALVLTVFVNLTAFVVALVGFLIYVPLYTYLKRRSPFSTHVGAIAGATPPLVGYAAAHSLDLGALLLFIIVFVWQMPHFFAIAMYRKKDYAAAGVPVWSVRYGVESTKVHLVAYTVLYVFSIIALRLSGYANALYIWIMGPLALVWLYFGVQGFRISDENKWARKMFFYSLILVLALCGALILQR